MAMGGGTITALVFLCCLSAVCPIIERDTCVGPETKAWEYSCLWLNLVCSPRRPQDTVELWGQSRAMGSRGYTQYSAAVASVSSMESQRKAKQGKVNEEAFHGLLRPMKGCKHRSLTSLPVWLISNGKKQWNLTVMIFELLLSLFLLASKTL